MQNRCSAIKADGKQCGAAAYQGRAWCWFHDPAAAADRERGRHLGGAARSNRQRARKQIATAAKTPAELQGVIGDAIDKVLKGAIEPGVANAVAALARASVSIREATEAEERLTALEEAVATVDLRRGA